MATTLLAMDRSALVTGASSGIGRELVRILRQRGVTVVASARNESALKLLAEETGCEILVADLAEPGAAVSLYAQARGVLGAAPDFVVNNAGYNSRKAQWVHVEEEEMDRQFAVNFRAPALICREALRDMKERKSGHIVNVLSTVALHANETMGLYTSMKEGLYGLTKVLIKEARAFGVKVTAMHPGGTDSDFREKERPDYMRPESVAQMIAMTLFSPRDVVVHELTFRPLVESNF